MNTPKRRKREKAIVGLLQEPTIQQAACFAGISESTLYRLLSDEEFQTEYREARKECVRQATARLQQACSTAVQTLLDVMVNDQAPTSSRVASARAVLELAYKAVEIEDLDSRLTALEQGARG